MYKYTLQYFEFLELHSSILKHFLSQKSSLILCALKFPLPYTHESINTMKTVNIPVILRSFIVFLLISACHIPHTSPSNHRSIQPPIYSTLQYVTLYFLKRLCKLNDQISRSVVSDSLPPHESQHARPPCPSPTPGVHSDSRQSSQ